MLPWMRSSRSGLTPQCELATPAGVGGAAGGWSMLYTGPVWGGAIGGAAYNATRQGLGLLTGKQESFDVLSLATDTAFGALSGGVGRVVGRAGSRVAGRLGGRVFGRVAGRMGGAGHAGSGPDRQRGLGRRPERGDDGLG